MKSTKILKAIISGILIAVLFSCLSFSCFAAEEDHLHQPNLSASHPVYVYVIYNVDGNPEYIQSEQYDPDDGRYTATTPDGVTVDVWYPVPGLTLVIHEIEEEAPMKWFRSVFPECSFIQPYEIFFLEEAGGRINLPDGIRIDFSNVSAKARMHLLNTEEEKTLLPQQAQGGKLTFYSDAETDYYVLGILKPAATKPETGDDSKIALLIGFAAIVAMLMIIVAALIFRPAKGKEEDLEQAQEEKAPKKEKSAAPVAPKEKKRRQKKAKKPKKTKKQKNPPPKKEGARRRGKKAPPPEEKVGVPPELNRYLNEIEDGKKA